MQQTKSKVLKVVAKAVQVKESSSTKKSNNPSKVIPISKETLKLYKNTEFIVV